MHFQSVRATEAGSWGILKTALTWGWSNGSTHWPAVHCLAGPDLTTGGQVKLCGTGCIAAGQHAWHTALTFPALVRS